MKNPTLEEIESYLFNTDINTDKWHDLLPSYQRDCVVWLVAEVKRLRHLTSRSSRAANAGAKSEDAGYKELFGILAGGRVEKPPPA